MTLRLHNTATGRKEAFAPLDPAHVRMYVCGPTVYDRPHVGNARPVVVFDVLYRLLRRRYPKVTYVRNVTDVDDKIMAAAAENGEPIAALTERVLAAFHADAEALGALPPGVEPRATAHIGDMVAMIERLLERGYAYRAEGHVLFHVPGMADYGALSRRDRSETAAGARVEAAPWKRDPADFVLWKPSRADQPGWESPWGRGRPGWHIECSAMSARYLGESFDIHGGGRDLIFPHHENERAQSECAHGAPFARYWVHNGYVTAGGRKMAKSLGNFVTVADALGEAPGEAVRLAMLKTHYRHPFDWSAAAVAEARRELDRFYRALATHPGPPPAADAPVPPEVEAALDDDLNTPRALAALHRLAGAGGAAAADALRRAGPALGLLAHGPAEWFQNAGHRSIIAGKVMARDEIAQSMGYMTIEDRIEIRDEVSMEMTWFGRTFEPDNFTVEDIEFLIEKRTEARDKKDFATADDIRKDLRGRGIILEDKPGGATEWRRA